MCQRHKSNLNKRTTFFESFVTVVKMEDIRTKSENTAPRQRAAAQIPKEAMRQLWLHIEQKLLERAARKGRDVPWIV